MKKIWLERLFSTMLIFFALAIYIQTLHFGKSITGPAFFPSCLAFILFACSAVLLIKTFMSKKDGDDYETLVFSKKAIATIGYFVVLVAVTIVVIPYVGWLLTQMILVFILEFTLGGRSWKRACIIAVIGAIVIYLIFEAGLQIHLPLGFLES